MSFAADEIVMQPWPGRRAQKSYQNCANGEDHERNGHDARTLVRLLRKTRFSEENVKHLARHVEGGEKCAEKTENERNLRWLPVSCGVENFIFAPKSGKEKWNACESHHSDCVSSKGDRHDTPQTAHPGYILLFEIGRAHV